MLYHCTRKRCYSFARFKRVWHDETHVPHFVECSRESSCPLCSLLTFEDSVSSAIAALQFLKGNTIPSNADPETVQRIADRFNAVVSTTTAGLRREQAATVQSGYTTDYQNMRTPPRKELKSSAPSDLPDIFSPRKRDKKAAIKRVTRTIAVNNKHTDDFLTSLKLRRESISKDGNCFFRAVADQLYGD